MSCPTNSARLLIVGQFQLWRSVWAGFAEAPSVGAYASNNEWSFGAAERNRRWVFALFLWRGRPVLDLAGGNVNH